MVAAEVMDGAVVRRWCRMAAEALGSARSAIDALNVYPVPDSDTGTNLYRTLRSAADAVDALAPGAGPEEIWRAAADGAMLGACGNSGIIVSQLLRGLADICAPASPCDGAVVARALGHAAELARGAVSRPAEGTVLTVADAAARAAAAAVTDAAALTAVVLAAGTAARRARDLTTEQLAVLAASGVVDAGAAGLCVVLDAWAAAIAGTQLAALDVPEPAGRAAGLPAAARPAESYGYEVTYLLQAGPGEVNRLREELDSMGDSLVIAGGPPPARRAGPARQAGTARQAGAAHPAAPAESAGSALWSVHVHVPEAGLAIEAGLRAGSLRRITVTYLGAPPPARHQVVAICDTPGMAALAESAGARILRSGSPSPSSAELSTLIRQAAQGARRCIVVPSGPATSMAAAAAARMLAADGIDVRVVTVASPVQALPALAVHEPAAGFADDAAAMSRAASRMRHAAISCELSADTAPGGPGPGGTRSGGPGPASGGLGPAPGGPAPGGPASGRPVPHSPAPLRPVLEEAALAATDELLAGGAELVTLLTGGSGARLAELVTARVREVSPAAEIECHAGAVAGHALLLGVE
ncbi:MAG TPA: DAK2 domain-containing protein [Streptosporangiaceae bacterium]|nr:DAK2 domain-containing protein [Streptosporangiaceae bacterium]